MADDEEEDFEESDMPRESEMSLQGPLASSALGPLSDRLDSVAEMIVQYASREQGTNLFNRDEPRLYAKMKYLLALTKAVGESDTKGFHFPDFTTDLIERDYQLRTSVKQQTRKILESITKIFERGGESGRRGGFLARGR